MKQRLLSFVQAFIMLAALSYAAAAEERAMSTIHVYLADGFEDDEILARVDGQEVYAKTAVTTMRLTSLADEFSFDAGGDRTLLEIELPAEMLATTIEIDPVRGRYIAVSVEDGRLTHFVSATPLGFH